MLKNVNSPAADLHFIQAIVYAAKSSVYESASCPRTFGYQFVVHCRLTCPKAALVNSRSAAHEGHHTCDMIVTESRSIQVTLTMYNENLIDV